MRKIIVLMMLSVLMLHAEAKNLGFVMNQKYACINQGAIVDKEIMPVFSKEDALKYPMRIMIDDKNILHSDGGKDLKLPFIEKASYGTSENRITLAVKNDQRFMIFVSKAMESVPMLYFCFETDNWTITH